MCIKSDFKEIFFKLVANDRSDKRILLTSNFCPLGVVCPMTYGYIHLFNHEKMCIKSEVEEIFVKLATNDQSDEAFQNVDIKLLAPMGCLPLPKSYIYA